MEASLVQRHLIFRLKSRVVYTFAVAFLFSLVMGKSDLGFRISHMEVDLSQRLGPAMAFELLDDPHRGSTLKGSFNIVPLGAGFPTFPPIRLEEVQITLVDSPAKASSRSLALFKKLKTPASNIWGEEEELFNDEEKERLRLAKQQNRLEIEDLVPRHEVSFVEKARQVIQSVQGSGDNLTTENSNGESLKVTKNGVSSGYKVQGLFEFVRDGSLILTDQHYIDVRRFEEGIPKEVADVDLVGATFSMNIASTRGMIVARLTNRSGLVEGEAKVSIQDLLQSKVPKLILKPRADRQRTRAVSAYGKLITNQTPPVYLSGYDEDSTIGKVKKEGSDENLGVQSLDLNSELLAEARSPHHYPTISSIHLSESVELTLLPEKMIKGLVQILSEQDIEFDMTRGDSLIWGTVKRKGKPISGVKVLPEVGQTSYFGGLFLPDHTRQKTSENGMFAVVVKEGGWQDIRLEAEDGQVRRLSTLVIPGKVTQLEADFSLEASSVAVRTFDAFNGEPLRTIVQLQEMDGTLDTGVEGVSLLDLPHTKNLSFLTAIPSGNYEKVRMSYSHLSDFLHIPLLSRDWLAEIKAPYKKELSDQTGTVVGFIQGDDFTIEIPNSTPKPIVYFDPSGKVISEGVSGGGFLAFGLDLEQVNLVIESKREHRRMTRILRPEAEYLQVVMGSFE